jgi:hypothetical protein
MSDELIIRIAAPYWSFVRPVSRKRKRRIQRLRELAELDGLGECTEQSACMPDKTRMLT